MLEKEVAEAQHQTILMVEVDDSGHPRAWQPHCECGWEGANHAGAGAARSEALQHHPKGVGDRILVTWPGKHVVASSA